MDMQSSLVIDKPNEKQKLAFKAKVRNIGYGGAKGGGKSWFVRSKAILLAANYPGIKILIVRNTFAELMQNHVYTLQVQLKDLARFNKSEMRFKFINGSVIQMGYCATDSDLTRYQGNEVDVIFFDEATTLTEHQMKTIAANVRGVNDFPKRVYYTCNPGGKGHAYIKRIFIDRNYLSGEDPEQYEFIQAKVYDNNVLLQSDPDYLKQLEALPSKQRAALLDGKWDVFEGQFFDDFINMPENGLTNNHVIEEFDSIPPGWTIFRSYDFGYAKPYSMAWYAVDYDGVLYRFLEDYGCTKEANVGTRLTPDEQFRRFREIETSHPLLAGRKIDGVADPSIWDKSRGESIAETAMKYGIYFVPGDNSRIQGWMQCHYRLQLDDNGYPMFYVTENCENFLRTIPVLLHSDTKQEDLDTDMEDHIADEWRYACMTRPIVPVIRKDKVISGFDPLNQRQRRNY